MVTVDFAKAFDAVCHMTNEFISLYINDDLVKWIKKFEEYLFILIFELVNLIMYHLKFLYL